MKLAYAKPCDGCGSSIYLAICRDGRWRPFELAEQPKGTPGTWAWRKRQGMEETEHVAGHGIHYCAEFHDQAFRFDGNFIHPHAEEAS